MGVLRQLIADYSSPTLEMEDLLVRLPPELAAEARFQPPGYTLPPAAPERPWLDVEDDLG